jgi:hypothetical protein
MRHPFDGIIVPPTESSQPTPARRTRRSLLKILAGALAALFGLSSRSQAQIQSKGTLSLALGEAGGTALTQAFKEDAGDPTKDPTKMRNEEGGPTTKALGEEGASTKRLGEEGGKLTEALKEDGGGATTLAIGEEGATTKAVGEEGATTRALGEEGATTNAIGEEGGKLTEALNEDGKQLTTQARREEGGIATTFAVGEEGGKQ